MDGDYVLFQTNGTKSRHELTSHAIVGEPLTELIAYNEEHREWKGLCPVCLLSVELGRERGERGSRGEGEREGEGRGERGEGRGERWRGEGEREGEGRRDVNT